MLAIKNLHATIDQNPILKGIDLEIKAGQVHAIMGPNGSGKSTLAHVISGRDVYDVTQGRIEFMDQDISELSVQDRAAQGIFLSFQYPVEIPGVKNTVFLRAALNAQRKARQEPTLDTPDFLRLVKEKAKQVGLKAELLQRPVNDGFSGGEKKRNEILQLLVLDPKLAILDETDSGLDIDALKTVADGVNTFKGQGKGVLLITHYQRLLDYIKPDVVHVLHNGQIIKSGDFSLAQKLEKNGYGWLGDSIDTPDLSLPTV